jgi:hypothetical protein
MSPTLLTGTIEPLVEYLTKDGQTPEAYLLNIFRSRDVVLLAEEHAIRHNLELAHRMIPLLYQAGVYTFGMEFGASEDQIELDQLVTGSDYDEEKARQIMFHYNTGWAYQEYLEIYRMAWSFNRSLPASVRKFRILNLSYQYNWAEAQRQFPDPDWRRRPQTVSEYWQQIRSYVDMQQRLAGLEPPPWLAGGK